MSSISFEGLFGLCPVNRSSVELVMCLANSNGNAQKSGTIFDQNLAILFWPRYCTVLDVTLELSHSPILVNF